MSSIQTTSEALPQHSASALISPETAQLALELAGVGVFEYDPRTAEQRFSRLCLSIWGLEDHEMPSPERLLELMHPDDRPLAQRAIDSLSPHGPGEFAIVHRIIRPDGALRWIETHGRTVFAANGQDRYALKSVGTMVDVTDRITRLQGSAADLSEGARGSLGTFIDLTEEALEKRSAELRQTLQTAAIGVTRVDRDLRYRLANSAYAKISGVPLERIIGHTVQEVLGPLALAKVRPYIDRVLSGETVEYEAELPWQAAGAGWIQAVYSPWLESDGTVSGWVASITDITARKHAQIALAEREEQLRLATEAAEVGLWDVDLLTDTLFWPPRVKAMFGISPDVPVSMADFYAGLHPEDRERTSLAFAAALDPERRALYDVEYRTVGKEDRVIRWVAAKGRGIFDATGKCVRVIGTAIDITARKQVQTALEEASRQKDEFLAMLAHELRNPLAPIGIASELLSRSLGEEDSHSRAAIGIIKRQFAQLTRLVDDLLDVSRITLGRIPLQMGPVDLAEVIDQAVETVEPQLREKRHGLAITAANYEPLYVNGDFARLVQCVANLLTNAIKYTEAGGQLSICSRADEQHAFIEVSDSGMGISAELLPRVFDIFVQSERTLDRSQGGLGIGLAVVKRLIEMHQGAVSARSEGVGHGSRFEIRLPRIGAPEPTKGTASAFAAVRRRVLIVDDNADAADSLSMLLAAEGHETEVAYRPNAALARAAAFRPDIALIDIGLPEMDGYQLAQRLRAMPELGRLRLFAVSGYGQPEDRQRSQAAGFDGHWVKPIDLAVLQRALGGSP